MLGRETYRVYEWFSYSHWGMFRLPLFRAPGWFVSGTCQDMDDEDIERSDSKWAS